MPSENQDFGPTNGLVKVSTENESTCSKITNSQSSPVIIEVFFEKDKNSNPGGTVPNWFYYWKQSPKIKEQLLVPGISLYDINSCSYLESAGDVELSLNYDEGLAFDPTPGVFNVYGQCLFNVANMDKEDLYPDCPESIPNELVVVNYGSAATINISEACGFKKNKISCTTGSGVHEGIHVFYTTVAHEAEHARIESEVWNYTTASSPAITGGYSSAWDLDKDGYKDIWEENDQGAIDYEFETSTGTNADAYTGDYGGGVNSNCDYCNGDCSPGTMYEEDRCRAYEGTIDVDSIDPDDWSFDPINDVQGKQWNNN